MPNNTQPDWVHPSEIGSCPISAQKCERWRLQKGVGCCFSLWWDEVVRDLPEETLTPAEKCFIVCAQSIYFCVQWRVLCNISLSTCSLSLLAQFLLSGVGPTVTECKNTNMTVPDHPFVATVLCLSLSPSQLTQFKSAEGKLIDTTRTQKSFSFWGNFVIKQNV